MEWPYKFTRNDYHDFGKLQPLSVVNINYYVYISYQTIMFTSILYAHKLLVIIMDNEKFTANMYPANKLH